jgi:restriction system protein
MTEISVPSPDQLSWPTLKAIRELGGSARNDEIEAKVANIEKYSSAVLTVPHTDRQTKFQYRLAWARTQLKNIGTLESRKTSVWVLTDLGQNIYEDGVLEALRANKRNQAALRKQQKLDLGVDSEQDLIIKGDGDLVVTEDLWIDEMLEILKKLSPTGFERLCQRILREAGFENVELTKRSNDKGIDGTGTWKQGILSWNVIFQCKRYAEKVGSPEIRNFKGTMSGRNEKGLFITTGTFTAEAISESRREGTRQIDLINGSELCELMKNLRLGASVAQKEMVTVQGEFFKHYE